jgi:hypothetical protein
MAKARLRRVDLSVSTDPQQQAARNTVRCVGLIRSDRPTPPPRSNHSYMDRTHCFFAANFTERNGTAAEAVLTTVIYTNREKDG